MNLFKKYKKSLLVAIFYTATAFFVCWPFLKNISHSLVPGDGLFTYWTMSWDIRSFLYNPGNIFNANIFYPYTNTLAYSEGLFVPALIALPMFLVLKNMIIVFNLMIFFSYILAAFGAYKLAKYYTKNNYASFIAGLIFGFATFRIMSMGHFQNIMIWWMPFATLFLQKFLDTKKRKYIVFFALLFSAQMLSCWNMGAFFALFVAFLLIANWKTIYDNLSLFLKDGLIALAIITILVTPFAYPYFKLHQETHFSYGVQEIANGSADIGGYIFPLPGTQMSRVTAFLGIEKKHWSENFNFLGYFSIFMLLYYFLFSKNKIASRNFKVYTLGIFVFVILSFGPLLRFFPWFKNFPLPYYLLVPFTGFVRTPSRISIIVLLCLSVSVAYIINSIKIKGLPLKNTLAFLAPLFILFEFWVPNGSLFTNTACPGAYSAVANDNSVSAMVEMPIQESPDGALEYVYYSTCHWKPIFNGFSGYFPKNYSKYSKKMRIFPEQKSLEFMQSIGISHVLLHLNDFEESQQKPLLEAVQQNSHLEIEYQDGKDYLVKIKK